MQGFSLALSLNPSEAGPRSQVIANDIVTPEEVDVLLADIGGLQHIVQKLVCPVLHCKLKCSSLRRPLDEHFSILSFIRGAFLTLDVRYSTSLPLSHKTCSR